MTLSLLEFTRRWALHVLPAGFTKTRQFGGWSNRRREAYLDRCVRLLDAAHVPLSQDADEFEPSRWETAAESEPCCPDCGGRLHLIAVDHRPSWRDVMFTQHFHRPLSTTLVSTCRSG